MKIVRYGEAGELLMRTMETAGVSERVNEIIANVAKRGDAALLEYCERFDGAKLESLAVSEAEIDAAMSAMAPELMRAMELAAENIRTFHSAQRREGFCIKNPDGTYRDIIHPINSDFRALLEKTVLDEYFAELDRIEKEGEATEELLAE